MADDRGRALSGWLQAIGAAGWHAAGLTAAAEAAGLQPASIMASLGDRQDAAAALADQVAEEAMLGAAEAVGEVRERLFDGLMRGFDRLQADRAAVSAMWEARDPGLLLLFAGRWPAAVRRLGVAAGMEVGGVSGHARLAALSLMMAGLFRDWLRDDSPDMAATMAAVDRALDKAERMEREGFSPALLGLPGLDRLVAASPLGWLRRTAPASSPDQPAE